MTSPNPMPIALTPVARRRGQADRRLRSPRGFTLVELLVVIAIIATLAGMLVFMLAGAREDSNRQRTTAQVRRIDAAILEKWEEVGMRPVRIPPASPLNALAGTLQGIRMAKLQATRESYRIEFPDRIPDIATDPLNIEATPAFLQYRQRLLQVYPGQTLPAIWGSAPDHANGLWTRAYEGAECLYLILSNLYDEDGNMLRFFNTSEIGDVDQDGMPEILDQWGQPIEFLRWAPGFRSAVQDQNPDTSPDPLDPFKVDSRWQTPVNGLRPYLLMPLVFSFGPDQVGNIVLLHQNPVINDPYAGDMLLGTQLDAPGSFGTYGDNIDNQSDIR